MHNHKILVSCLLCAGTHSAIRMLLMCDAGRGLDPEACRLRAAKSSSLVGSWMNGGSLENNSMKKQLFLTL